MNKRLIGWIIFVIVILAIIGYIAMKQSGNDDNSPQDENTQTPNQEDLASTDLDSTDEDFNAIDEGLDGLN